MIYYVGDTHGSIDAVKAADEAAEEAGVKVVVQVGDFGIHWPNVTCEIAKYFLTKTTGTIWYTCGGNHDNWDRFAELSKEQGNPDLVELAPNCFYVQRGSVVTLEGENHLFFGGAESTDKHRRVEGQTWWKNETPSYEEFGRFFEAMETNPDVVVTHDAPLNIPIKRINRDKNPTPRNLHNAIKLCTRMPKRWYFGHHHVVQSWSLGDTEYYCCGLHGEYQSY